MKTLLATFSFLLIGSSFLLAQKTKELDLGKTFVSTATGYYDNKKVADTTQIATLKRQFFLVYPFWQDEAPKGISWVYLGWFFPEDKENSLEQGLCKIYQNDAKEWKVDIFRPESSRATGLEWQKKKPFGELVERDLTYFCSCTLSLVDNKGIQLKSDKPCTFPPKDASFYNSLDINLIFYPNKYTNACVFYGADGKIVFANEHIHPHEKVSKNYKKF